MDKNKSKQQKKLSNSMQDRREMGIANFNALNNAVQILLLSTQTGKTHEEIIKEVYELKDKLFSDHLEFKEKFLERTGEYNVKDSVELLNSATSLKDLNIKWLTLSQMKETTQKLLVN